MADLEALFHGRSFVSVAEYMAWNNRLYYEKPDVFGVQGDFITAPELTPIFGYTVAQWVMGELTRLKSDYPPVLIEFGPGRGLLMRDMLKALKSFGPGFEVQPVLVDFSEKRRAEQKQTLSDVTQNVKFISHISELEVFPGQPIIGVANEFFDAFPVQQWRKEGKNLYEKGVKKQGQSLEFTEEKCIEKEGNFFSFSGKKIEYPLFQGEGVYEYSAEGVQYFQEIMGVLARQKGSFLMIDYGDLDGVGDTLQALKNHEKVQLLQYPGEADLTAHVRFSAYENCVPKAWFKTFETQGNFLRKLGVEALFMLIQMQEMTSLKTEKNMQKNAQKEQKNGLLDPKNALKRVKKRLLGHEKGGMGNLFKILEVKTP